MKIRHLVIIFLLLLFAKALHSQEEAPPVQEEIPLTSFDVIQRQGKQLPLTARERAEIQRIIRDIMEDLVATMTLSTLEERPDYRFDRAKYDVAPRSIGDPDTKTKFLNLFPEELWDQPIIYNFFQPGKKESDPSTPDMFSPRAYTDSLSQWFHTIDILMMQRPVTVSDFYYKYPKQFFKKGRNYINVILPIRFTGRCSDQSRIFELCQHGEIIQNIRLNIVIELSDQTQQLETGEEVPLTYKIRFIERHPEFERPKELGYRNWWAFSGIHLSSGITNASTTTAAGYPELEVSGGYSIGAIGKMTFFFNDTLSLLGKKKLWDIGADLGIGITQQTYDFRISRYYETFVLNQTPINNLVLQSPYNLIVNGNDLVQNASLTFLNVPLSLVFKRYFTQNRVNAVTFEIGAAYNMLLSQNLEQQSGSLFYVGDNMQFAPGFDPITVTDLPQYGFGIFDAKLKDDPIDPFNSYYISAHIRTGFSFRKNKFARLHYMITPWFNYAVTDLSANNVVTDPVYNTGTIDNQAIILSEFKPYSFGIDIGISYNLIKNNLKNVR